MLPRCLLFLVAALTLRAAEPVEIPLWPEGVPNDQAGAAPEKRDANGGITNVQVPTLTFYRPASDRPAKSAVIVCPGGGYTHLSMAKEGTRIAEWLNALGVPVFVLKYRLVEFGQPAPLQDVLRAVRIVRSRAAELGYAADRIGVLGFSAGGHLAACAGTMFDYAEGRTGAALDAVSARPDFLVLVYPVILMDGPFAHAGSRTALLGATPAPELVQRFSPALHVTAQTPPAILISTFEDRSVPPENALAYYEAMHRAGVPGELHVFEQGAHGVGIRDDVGTTSGWPQRCAEWLRSRGWLR